ncbi:MAG: hypothetical protein KC416_13095, partial [Myxococcales bacterium]|nr:hypothetical protein [Myxococcales bacterium]
MTDTTTIHPATEGDTRRGLIHLAIATTTVLGLVAITYVAPTLERFRPWIGGEPVPLLGLLAKMGEDPTELPSFAESGEGYVAPTKQNLSPAVAKNLGKKAGTPAKGTPLVFIDPKEYENIDVEIAGRTHLAHFYESLRQTALRKTPGITRISHYGDSSIATDLITHTVRRNLQLRFGDAGHGFILIARGTMPWLHRDIVHNYNDQWDLRELVRIQDKDGYYGFGGVQYRGMPGGYASFATNSDGPVGQAVSRFDVYYRRDPRGGKFKVRIDGDEPRWINTRGEAGDAVERISVPDGDHKLTIQQPQGFVRLYGVALERETPGVVYDSLGLVGARVKRLLNYDKKHIQAQIGERDPDLLILGFG